MDDEGIWAWPADDPYAAPTRHASARAWMELHPTSSVRLWLSTCFAHGAYPELARLRLHAEEHGVQVVSTAPWWSHAAAEAGRCLPVVVQSMIGQTCVVEGEQVTWIVTRQGALRDVRHLRLQDRTVDALQAAITCQSARDGGTPSRTVVLGHGLSDGRRASALDAHVLGRLDGSQPPHWLRPTASR